MSKESEVQPKPATTKTDEKKGASSAKPKKPKAATKLTKVRLNSLMANLDISSMHNDDVAAVLLHCASVLNSRRTASNLSLSEAMANAFQGCCWTKAGDSPIVTIKKDGRVKGHLPSKEVARKYHIPNCGG
ncbi:hypothetical protein Mesau_00576 [Mesorhizobium australicum WSM2073]|uniref:Uncharacterized protein n=1 Tax=Mesorhizobium australicum (strain HAMBI 3006 / LMG 24608 / WSM2073) TaxID=754035 RepID=L0KEW3_MESAW|nr:hypothetical protein [Mesorhizobium australicum]AGB43065.1 hypothetical protein Mesau_00576 [Mesorhizobium australicum WSM2073]